MVGVIEVSGPFLVQHGWVGQRGYAYSFGFKPFFIKSAFEPITPPLKCVLADAACKVSMIFFNIASGLCWEMPNGVKFLIFIRVFGFSRLRVKSFGCS